MTYKFATRLNWLFNGKDSSTKCLNPNCDKTPALYRQLRMNDDFPTHCCPKCKGCDPVEKQRERELRLEKNGGKWLSDEAIEKLLRSIAKNLEEDPDFWKKAREKGRATKVANGHDPDWNNRPKMKETVEKHKSQY